MPSIIIKANALVLLQRFIGPSPRFVSSQVTSWPWKDEAGGRAFSAASWIYTDGRARLVKIFALPKQKESVAEIDRVNRWLSSR
jgi:hypothetical protein